MKLQYFNKLGKNLGFVGGIYDAAGRSLRCLKPTFLPRKRPNPVFECAKYNTDGHLIDAMCSASSDNFFLQVSYPDEEAHYYLTTEDRVNDKRLNVVGFSKLKTVQLFMDKELSQVGFNIAKLATNKVSCTQTEDAQNTIYTLTYNLDGGIADSCDTYYFRLSEGFADKRFVLNKIVFIYDC